MGKIKTIAALDGVRAIACLSIISYHVHYEMQHAYNLGLPFGTLGNAVIMSGWSGVTLFLVLSGFLLFMPYAQAMLDAKNWPSIRTFYLRRALRILPGYYVSLFLLILLKYSEYLRPDHLKQLGLFLTFLMDAPFTYQQINGPFWTLAVEWQYYMLLPFLALAFSWIIRWGSTRQKKFRLIICCLVAMILWGIGTRYIGVYYTLHPSETLFVPRNVLNWILLVIYGSSGKYLEDFALGMLVCTIYVYVQSSIEVQGLRYRINRASIWLWGSGILLLFFMSVWYVFPALFPLLASFIGAHNWLCELGYAVGYGLCIIAILYGGQGLKSLFEGRAIRLVGRISYSLYIWHLPIIIFFMGNSLLKWPHSPPLIYILYWLCVLLLVIPFSYLFYRIVELPGIKLAHKSRARFDSGLACSVTSATERVKRTIMSEYQQVIAALRTSYNSEKAGQRDQTAKESWKVTERQQFLSLLLQEGKTSLLEVGAGTGNDGIFFQNNGINVVCTDLSPDMIKLCREKGLNAHVMDFLTLDFPPVSFDAIYALNCLLHVPTHDLPTVLQKLQELLRPGGLFFLGVYGGFEREGVSEEDWHRPQRFFAHHTDEFMQRAVAPYFDLVSFKSIPLQDNIWHFQSMVLRR